MENHYVRLDKYLSKYCPTLVSFISLADSKWENINQRFDKRMQSIGNNTTDGRNFEAATTIYDLILQSETGNVIARSFLSLIENIYKDIVHIIPSQFHTKLYNSTMNLLSDFDTDRSGYLNPIGELQAMLSLVKNSDYKLKDIERPLPNGKTADYCFTNHIGEEILIEVTNIHFKDGMIETESDLVSFLSGRIEDKLKDKLAGLNYSEFKKKLTLLPVLWCNFEDVHKHQKAFDVVEAKYETLPFCIMGQTPLEDGSYTFRFSTVKRLIEAYQNQINYKSGA